MIVVDRSGARAAARASRRDAAKRPGAGLIRLRAGFTNSRARPPIFEGVLYKWTTCTQTVVCGGGRKPGHGG